MVAPLPHCPPLSAEGFAASDWQRWFGQLRQSVAVLGQPVSFGAFGANGKTPQGPVVLPAAAGDLPTAIALANAMRAALIANGIGA